MTVPRNWWNIANVAVNETENDEKVKKQLEAATLFLKDVYNILNKGIIPTDNMRGALLSVTFTALNSNTSIKHGLNFVPSNYFVVGTSGDMRVYDGVTLNDLTYANFRVAGTTGSARVFLF